MTPRRPSASPVQRAARKGGGGGARTPGPTALRILLVESDATAARRTSALLRAASPAFAVERVASIAAALAALPRRGWSAVLCAARLADGDVLDLLRDPALGESGVPVMVLRADDVDPALAAAVQAGAAAWLAFDPADRERLGADLHHAIERAHSARQMAWLANYDRLTGLANRQLFRDRLQQAMLRADRAHRMVALLSLDLDRFKAVNDALGHGGGDELLIAMANRLRCCVRRMDTIARVGSDEFAVIIEEVDDTRDVDTVCRKIASNLAEPVIVRGEEVCISTSIGVSLYPEDAGELNELMRTADVAMDRAKAEGRGRARRFSPELRSAVTDAMQLEAGLRHALADDGLFLCYQPQLSLQTGEVVGVEALLRWQHPRLGVIMPAGFIPLAEESGLIVSIGEWVLRRACRDQRRWQNSGYEITVAVNLSARQFRQGNLGAMVEAVIEETAADPNQLVFEITESVLLEDSDHSRQQLDALKAMGVMVYLDDFGTGYSSLSYLKRFAIDGLKIDRSFIHDIPGDPEEGAIPRAIIALGRALRLDVVAEGVENAAQLELLIREGCDQVQGYFFSRPLPFEELVSQLPTGFAREALAQVTQRASAAMGGA
jgi:diguanylate cyclase (GGDEF)-like protein